MQDTKNLVVGIIYSKFDVKLGPTPVVWVPPELPYAITDLISLKSINLLAGEEGTCPTSLAIIPFPTQNLKGLIKSIEIKDITTRGGAINCSLTVLFNEADELLIYKCLNGFEQLFNEASAKLVKLEEEKAEKQELEDEIKKFYTIFMGTLINYLVKFKKMEEEPEEVEKSLILLYNLIRKDLDKVVNALVLGDESIIITGDQALVKLIINTLTLFTAEEKPEIKYWVNQYASGDLIGGPSFLLDVYKSGVKVDLKSGKVIGGTSNKFCKNLINHAKELDVSHAEQYIQKQIRKITSISSKVLETIKQNKISETQIENLVTDLEFDECDLIEILLKSKHPALTDDIDNVISMCRKKMSKILSGFEKQKW